MHEFSVVQSLLTTIERYAAEQKSSAVTKVVVRFGPLSGIVPHLLTTAFDTFKEGTVAEKAELVLNGSRLRISCRSCGETSERDDLVFRCPSCNSHEVRSEEGDELILESLEMEC